MRSVPRNYKRAQSEELKEYKQYEEYKRVQRRTTEFN
jgi:hypothetical protein